MMLAFKRNTKADTPKTKNWRTKNIKDKPKTLGETLMSLLIFTIRDTRSDDAFNPSQDAG